MDCQDQTEKQILNTDGSDCRTKLKLSDNYNAYRAKSLSVLSEFQYMWDAHLGLIEAAKHQIEINSAGKA